MRAWTLPPDSQDMWSCDDDHAPDTDCQRKRVTEGGRGGECAQRTQMEPTAESVVPGLAMVPWLQAGAWAWRASGELPQQTTLAVTETRGPQCWRLTPKTRLLAGLALQGHCRWHAHTKGRFAVFCVCHCLQKAQSPWPRPPCCPCLHLRTQRHWEA